MQTTGSGSRIRKLARAVRARYSDWRQHAFPAVREVIPPLPATRIASFDQYASYLETHADLYEERRRISRSMVKAPGGSRRAASVCRARPGEPFLPPLTVKTFMPPDCPTGERASFARNVCSIAGCARPRTWCGHGWHGRRKAASTSPSRTRRSSAGSRRDIRTRSAASSSATGPRGESNNLGFRHEDMTALTFPDASLKTVVSLEVLEHVPDFMAAPARVRPGN